MKIIVKILYGKYFMVLTLLFLLSVVVAVYFCECPLISFFDNEYFQWLCNGDKNEPLYDVSLSIIVSYIFYLFSIYLPKKIDEIPRRIAIYREMQVFMVRIKMLLKGIIECGIKNSSNEKKFKNIDEILTSNNLLEAARKIEMNTNSNMITPPMTWAAYCKHEFNDIYIRGQNLLNRYNSYLDALVFEKIFYIVNESTFFIFLREQTSSGQYLFDYIPVDGITKEYTDLYKFFEVIHELLDYLRLEYKKLKKFDYDIKTFEV